MIDANAGPDAMFSDTLPTSRGQHETIATLACDLLDQPRPKTRLEGTILIARLKLALQDEDYMTAVRVPVLEAF